MTIRILLGDDHPLVRRGLRELLEREPDMAVVAEADDGDEAVAKALRDEVDLAILDVAMPRMTGLQASVRLRAENASTRVLMLSMYDSEQYVFASLRAGASGYILKSHVDSEVVDACRRILRGELVFPMLAPSQVAAYVERVSRGEVLEPDRLTSREREVLKLVAEGNSSQKIADILVISIKTVERHRANIMEKLELRDRVALTRYAIRNGLVEP